MVVIPESYILRTAGSHDPMHVVGKDIEEYNYMLAPKSKESYGSCKAFNHMQLYLSEDSYNFGYRDDLKMLITLELDGESIRYESINYPINYLSDKSENTLIDLMERGENIYIDDVEKEDIEMIIVEKMGNVLLENVFRIRTNGRCQKLSTREVEALALGRDVIRFVPTNTSLSLDIESILDNLYDMFEDDILGVKNYRNSSMINQIALSIKEKLILEGKITEKQTREIIKSWMKWHYYPNTI